MAGKIFHQLRYVLLTIWITAIFLYEADGQECGSFIFPNLTGDTLTVAEHTNAILTFEQVTEGCNELLKDVKILVGRKAPDTAFQDYCSIVRVEGNCAKESDNTICTCLTEPGKYEFRKNVSRNDSGTWIWDTSDSLRKAKRNIKFEITYPPVIETLRLNSQSEILDPMILPENKSLDIVCSWQNGNPPVTARLLDRHGAELVTSSNSGQVLYRFEGVRCKDAGLIRCQVPSLVPVKEARLLVICPPDFIDASFQNINMDEGQTAEVTFRVRTHENNFHDCSVTTSPTSDMKTLTPEQTNSSVSVARDFACVSLTGTPPDLTLTVRLVNLRTQDAGKWRVQLTNAVGSGHLDFVLVVKERVDNTTVVENVTVVYYTDPPTTTQTPTETTAVDIESPDGDAGENSSSGPGGAVIAAVIIVLILIAVAAGVAYYFFVHKKKAQLTNGGVYMNTPSYE